MRGEGVRACVRACVCFYGNMRTQEVIYIYESGDMYVVVGVSIRSARLGIMRIHMQQYI